MILFTEVERRVLHHHQNISTSQCEKRRNFQIPIFRLQKLEVCDFVQKKKKDLQAHSAVFFITVCVRLCASCVCASACVFLSNISL